MEKVALIVAGGKGERMGSITPKQFLLLKNIQELLKEEFGRVIFY